MLSVLTLGLKAKIFGRESFGWNCECGSRLIAE